MAKKGGMKEVNANSCSANMNSEHKTHESDKNKIAKIHDMLPHANRDLINKVLLYCNGDDSEAVNVLLKDGGQEAMAYMLERDNYKIKSNKNKRKKKKSKNEMFPSSSFDADDSSSLHSSSNIDLEVEKDSTKTKTVPDATSEINNDSKCPKERLGNVTSVKTAQTQNSVKDQAKNYPNIEAKPSKEIQFQHSALEKRSTHQETLWKSGFSSRGENKTCGSPESDYSEKLGQRKDNFQTSKDERYSKYSSKQRSGSFHRSKTSSLSEDNSSHSTSQAAVMPTARGYDKCKKDLSRQTTSLQRIQIQLEKGLDDSSKRLKNAFTDIRKILDKRQEFLEQQMEQTKKEALSLLKSRQDLAIELKKRVDRVSCQSESDDHWLDLRSDIKQYVIERKYDEELANPVWFLWSMDTITENLNNFGEVRPVKNVYSQRSHSLLGNVTNVEPSPVTSVTAEGSNPIADKNDNTTETITGQPAAEKEVRAPYKGQTQTSRVFSNKHLKMNRYPNQTNQGKKFNMGRGQPRGQYGGGNNYGNNNHSNYDHQSDFRYYPPNHSRPHHRPDHQNDHTKSYNRNTNANLPMENRNNEKGSGRGGRGGSHNSMNNRNRINRNLDPRLSTENTVKTSAPAPEIVKDNANPEKPSAINGY